MILSITIKEIEHLAALSRLLLTDGEKERLATEMSGIIDFAGKIAELDVGDIKPTMHASDIFNVFREDVVCESLPTQKILANAPESDEGCFIVPKAVD